MKNRHAGEIFVENYKFLAFLHFPKSFTQELIKFIDTPNEYDTQSLSYMHFAKHSMYFYIKLYIFILHYSLLYYWL